MHLFHSVLIRVWLPLAASVLVLFTAAAAQAEAPTAIPVEGQPFDGRLAGVDADWKLRFDVEGQSRELPAGDLALWGTFKDASAGPQVLLGNGGLIVADVLQIDREQLRGVSETFGEIKLPLGMLTGVLFHPPSDARRRDQLVARVHAASGESDRVLLDNGDELTGTLSLEPGKPLALQTELGKVDVELDQVAAVVFNPALANKSRLVGLRSWIGLRDGSRMIATGLSAEGDQARLKLPGGVELKASLDSTVALQPLGGKATYLSDLRTAGYRHIPYLQLPWDYQNDRNVNGGHLRADGRLHLKGLGMHSASRLAYDLDKGYRALEGQLAIDDSTGGRGSVVFRVFVDDGSGKWQPRFQSPVVRGGDKPVPLSVDLQGVKRVSLLVEFADWGDELDHANWLDVRLVE